jgi:hypothetical protein
MALADATMEWSSTPHATTNLFFGKEATFS